MVRRTELFVCNAISDTRHRCTARVNAKPVDKRLPIARIKLTLHIDHGAFKLFR
jgi:hypothetical protein